MSPPTRLNFRLFRKQTGFRHHLDRSKSCLNRLDQFWQSPSSVPSKKILGKPYTLLERSLFTLSQSVFFIFVMGSFFEEIISHFAKMSDKADAYNALIFLLFFSSLIIGFSYLCFFLVLTVNVTLFIFCEFVWVTCVGISSCCLSL